MSESIIQPASPIDLEFLVALRRQLYEDDPGASSYNEQSGRHGFLELFRDPALGRVWAAHEHNRIVGYLLLTFCFSLELDGRIAFVDELVVERGSRGRGLGEALLVFAENAARQLGIKVIHLEVSPGNAAAMQLYEKQGYARRPYSLLTRRL